MISKERLLRSRKPIALLALFSVAIFVRLIKISQPFVDAWSWRQGDVAMIAENFYRHGFNILYPQINWAGISPGYVGTEFPLVPYIASLLYVLVGVQEWIGRSISVIFFALSLPFFYLLVKNVFNERSAFFAVGAYILAPLGIFTSRSFMPDMPALSLSIIALYYFILWLDTPRNLKLFIVAAFLTTLAILVKLPSIIIGLPFLYISWRCHGPKLFQKPELWVFVVASLILPVLWYSHAYSISLKYFPFHMFGEKGLRILPMDQYWEILRRTIFSGLTPTLFAAMLFGMVVPVRGDLRYVFHWWLLAIALFVFFAGEGNRRHEWYQLPIVPVAAAFAGLASDFGLARLKKRMESSFVGVATCILFFSSLGYGSYSDISPLYRPQAGPFWKAGRELSNMVPHGALVIFAGDVNPSAIYYSKRKGCYFYHPKDSQDAIETLERLRRQGGRYLVLNRYSFWWLATYKDFQRHLDLLYERVSDNSEYIIFDLSNVDFEGKTLPMKGTEAKSNVHSIESTREQSCSCPAPGYRCPKASYKG